MGVFDEYLERQGGVSREGGVYIVEWECLKMNIWRGRGRVYRGGACLPAILSHLWKWSFQQFYLICENEISINSISSVWNGQCFQQFYLISENKVSSNFISYVKMKFPAILSHLWKWSFQQFYLICENEVSNNFFSSMKTKFPAILSHMWKWSFQ